MKLTRRSFLKGVGLITLSGLGGISLTQKNTAGLFAAQNSQTSLSSTTQESRRWAFVIDMSKFKGEDEVQGIIDTCHKVHNVPSFDNGKDDIKWAWADNFEHMFPTRENPYLKPELKESFFLGLCNHCENPPCVRVCPTKATFKRSDGIVVVDYHRCIGCRFCMAACPYGARSFNFRDPRPEIKELNPEFPTRTKGVVEKCNFCMERILEGEIPVCAEQSGGAILFGDLNDPDSEVRKALSKSYTIRRKPQLGTEPSIYYVIEGDAHA